MRSCGRVRAADKARCAAALAAGAKTVAATRRVAAVGQAILVSQDRLGGARKAGDAAGESLQSAAIAVLLVQLGGEIAAEEQAYIASRRRCEWPGSER